MDENAKRPVSAKKDKAVNSSGCLSVLLVVAVVVTLITIYNYSLDRKLLKEIEAEGQSIYKVCTAKRICPTLPQGWSSSGLGMKNLGSVKVIGKTRKQTLFYYVTNSRDKFLLCRRTRGSDQQSCFSGGVNLIPSWQSE